MICALLLSSLLGTFRYEGMVNKDDNKSLGVTKNEVPTGEEDLYILKSQIVPPVCPVCPSSSSSSSTNKQCPPCPPCARCPEPSFDCKKIPKYSSNNDYLPRPIVADFSSFGV